MCFYIYSETNETTTFNTNIYITEFLNNYTWTGEFGSYLEPKFYPHDYFVKPNGTVLANKFYSKVINDLGEYVCLRNTWHTGPIIKPWNGEFKYDITFNDLQFDQCFMIGNDMIQFCGMHTASEEHYCAQHPPIMIVNANGGFPAGENSGVSGWLWVGIGLGLVVIVAVIFMCMK